jgi:hypothetical protein
MKFGTAWSAIVLPLLLTGVPLAAQNGPEPMQGQPPLAQPAPTSAPALPMEQLVALLAPIALYPDPLLAQVLAASTYPLEIVEAQQWLQQNRSVTGAQLIEAARQQNWDASVQALVAFPDAVALLARDIRWTTDVGNAFLSQQQDVMNAIQSLRARAQGNGQLVSGPQQVVTSQAQSGQSAIAIQPANPQVIYVPMYNPQAVWGPQFVSSYGPPPVYPAPYYQGGFAGGYGEGYGGGYGSGFAGSAIRFGAGVVLNALFSGVTHFTGWGWALNWLVNTLFTNPLFFHNNGYQGYGGYGGGYSGGYGAVAWVHNPVHRLGIAYPNRTVAAHYATGFRGTEYRSQAFRNAGYREPQTLRAAPQQSYRAAANYGSGGQSYRAAANDSASSYRRYANSAPQQYGRSFAQPNTANRSAFTNAGNWSTGNQYSSPRAQVSTSASRSEHYSAPHYQAAQASHYSAPKAPHYSAPKAPHYSAPKAPHYSAPHSSGGHGGGGSHGGKGSKRH